MVLENGIFVKLLGHWPLILFVLIVAAPALLLHWREFNAHTSV